jgi:hypothetical protein
MQPPKKQERSLGEFALIYVLSGLVGLMVAAMLYAILLPFVPLVLGILTFGTGGLFSYFAYCVMRERDFHRGWLLFGSDFFMASTALKKKVVRRRSDQQTQQGGQQEAMGRTSDDLKQGYESIKNRSIESMSEDDIEAQWQYEFQEAKSSGFLDAWLGGWLDQFKTEAQRRKLEHMAEFIRTKADVTRADMELIETAFERKNLGVMLNKGQAIKEATMHQQFHETMTKAMQAEHIYEKTKKEIQRETNQQAYFTKDAVTVSTTAMELTKQWQEQLETVKKMNLPKDKEEEVLRVINSEFTNRLQALVPPKPEVGNSQPENQNPANA